MRQLEMPVLNGFGRTGHLVVAGSQQDESAVGDAGNIAGAAGLVSHVPSMPWMMKKAHRIPGVLSMLSEEVRSGRSSTVYVSHPGIYALELTVQSFNGRWSL